MEIAEFAKLFTNNRQQFCGASIKRRRFAERGIFYLQIVRLYDMITEKRLSYGASKRIENLRESGCSGLRYKCNRFMDRGA